MVDVLVSMRHTKHATVVCIAWSIAPETDLITQVVYTNPTLKLE